MPVTTLIWRPQPLSSVLGLVFNLGSLLLPFLNFNTAVRQYEWSCWSINRLYHSSVGTPPIVTVIIRARRCPSPHNGPQSSTWSSANLTSLLRPHVLLLSPPSLIALSQCGAHSPATGPLHLLLFPAGSFLRCMALYPFTPWLKYHLLSEAVPGYPF